VCKLSLSYQKSIFPDNLCVHTDAWDYWVNDPLHRANLLDKLFTGIGLSVVKGSRGTFYYTMDLARPVAP